MMRGDSHADHDDCHSGCCNKSSQAKPVPRPAETGRFLADLSQHIPGEEWRERGLGSAAQNIPQLVVILTFHSLQSIEPFTELEVALEWVTPSLFTSLCLPEIHPVFVYGLEAGFR